MTPIKKLSRVGLAFVAMVAAVSAVQAQSATNRFSLANPFSSTIASAGQSNLVYFRPGGINVTPPAGRPLRNSPLGIGISVQASTVAVAGLQCGIALQPTYDGVNYSNDPWWVIIPAGIGPTNIAYATNLSQAVVGNAVGVRIGAITNGHASSLVVSNVTLSYFY